MLRHIPKDNEMNEVDLDQPLLGLVICMVIPSPMTGSGIRSVSWGSLLLGDSGTRYKLSETLMNEDYPEHDLIPFVEKWLKVRQS